MERIPSLQGVGGGGRGEMIKDLLAVFSHLYPPNFRPEEERSDNLKVASV